MNPINIYFFAIASLLGLENARIVSQKASVTIDPIEKTFEILQQDLFSIIMTAEDSLISIDELQNILEFDKHKNVFDGLTIEEIVLSKQDRLVNAVIKGRYSDVKVWEEAGIHLDDSTNAELAIMDIPEWNIQSSQAVLTENYWRWPANKSVTLVMEPYNNIPEEYLKHRHSILQYWEKRGSSAPNDKK